LERRSLKIPPSHYVQFSSLEDSWSEGMLLLMYHAIAAPPLFHGQRGLYVTSRHLGRQIRELKRVQGVEFTTLGEWNRQRPVTRQVTLTFDDAYRSLFVHGLPVLRELGVQAVTYVVASLIGKSNEWDHALGARHEPLMDGGQLNEWIKAGHEVGSHGLSHLDLTMLTQEEARREIAESKARLEDLLGQPVRHFCYPYGGWSNAVREMVQEAGYETGVSTAPGFNLPASDPFTLKRYLARHRRPWLAAITR
jgi:peptidoglycan/xylan/chitin deacetylase (PgdA/CDA1 family)